jgi:hypothetical protein
MRQHVVEIGWEELMEIEADKNPLKLIAKMKEVWCGDESKANQCDTMSDNELAHYIADMGICNIKTAALVAKGIRASKKDTSSSFVHRGRVFSVLWFF